MSQSPDSLEAVAPWLYGDDSKSAMTDPQPDTRETKLEGGVESPPEFDRVADVLGPLEQIVQSADQRLGTIQQQVAAEAGNATAEVDRKVRDAANEQRGRVAELRKELTDRVSELAGRFDALLSVLDEVDRELAVSAGEVRVTMTERQRVEIAHEQPDGAPPAIAASAGAPPGTTAAQGETAKPRKEKGIRRWFRRSKRSSA